MNEMNDGMESGHAEGAEHPRAEAVSVEIYDQVYHLRGTDPAYIEQLAAVVDAKMRAVAARGATVDSLRVAVLASLNIADELVLLRQQFKHVAGLLAESRTSQTTIKTLSGMLDELLEVELDGQEVRRAG